jgi:hypothetical protein
LKVKMPEQELELTGKERSSNSLNICHTMETTEPCAAVNARKPESFETMWTLHLGSGLWPNPVRFEAD